MDITDAVEKRLQEDFAQIHIGNMQNTFVVGFNTNEFIENVCKNHEFLESNCKLAMGGVIVEEIRSAVLQKTGKFISYEIQYDIYRIPPLNMSRF